MYNTSDSAYIKVNDSIKNSILIGLVILLICSLVSGYILSLFDSFEGTELGRIIFLLFILSEIPILVNYFYLVANRVGLRIHKISSIFTRYYTPGLMFHSGIYTIVISLTLTHVLLVVQQSINCMIFILILGLLWTIEYSFWLIDWPLYPRRDQKEIFLYWLQWVTLFGILIGLPFHVKIWSLFWLSVFPTLTFGSLLIVIFQDFRNKRTNTQILGKLDAQNLVT
ncbi:MAG: hypothetical protein ACFFB5_07225 [Promethearchaeota archaeon]